MQMRSAGLRFCALACGTFAALALPVTSFATTKTTTPSAVVIVQVGIHDWGITMGVQQQVEPGQYAYASKNSVARGQIGDFQIQNLGKKPHNFAVLGKKTGVLAPGARGTLHLYFLVRGTFPWTSTLDTNKKGFRGVLVVT